MKSSTTRFAASPKQLRSVSASLSNENGSPSKEFDYDLVIIGAGVGGHGAALHAVEKVTKIIIHLMFPFVQILPHSTCL